jgi:hypothetical protein
MTRAVLNKLENDGRVLLPSGEGTHDKQVSVFEDRPEPHPAWVSGELIAVFRTLVVYDRPFSGVTRNPKNGRSQTAPTIRSVGNLVGG